MRGRVGTCLLALLAGQSGPSEVRVPQGKRPESADKPLPVGGRVETVKELGLTLAFPAELSQLQPLAADEPSSQRKAGWSTRLGTSKVWVYVYSMPREAFGYVEPDDVSEDIRDNFRKNHDAGYAFDRTELVTGPFGYAPYASLGWGPLHDKDGKSEIGTFFVLGGLELAHGYAVEVECRPVSDEAAAEIVLGFLRKGVSCDCKPRNPQWTEEEVRARWLKDAPSSLAKKLEKPLRTKHYLFLSNTDAAKQMGDYMEKFYAAIQKVYPFPEVPGRRLMPVFLFRNQDEYYGFFAAVFKSTKEEAMKSKGVAFRDFYATYYDAPQDPVHIHEATHQVFANRLRLGGGGSWFQEGVAEYMSTAASDRTDASNLVKKERHLKLSELVSIKSLLWTPSEEDKRVEGRSEGNYREAALLIEFVRESKWSQGKFLDWVHAMGECPPNNVGAIEHAMQATLGVDLGGFEGKWVEYCKNR